MSIKVFQSQPKGYLVFTSSQNWTVPPGVHRIKILMIGGGGGGGGGYSTTYVGGGGGAGAIVFVEAIVVPGLQLAITIGAGGSGGAGGASPANGGNGGETSIDFVTAPAGVTGSPLVGANYGTGGGAATSAANGGLGTTQNFPGGANVPYIVMVGSQGQDQFIVLALYGASGAGGSGQAPNSVPVLEDGFTATSPAIYGFNNGQNNLSYGSGGRGGGVNSNGGPGIQGLVVIWWSDD